MILRLRSARRMRCAFSTRHELGRAQGRQTQALRRVQVQGPSGRGREGERRDGWYDRMRCIAHRHSARRVDDGTEEEAEKGDARRAGGEGVDVEAEDFGAVQEEGASQEVPDRRAAQVTREWPISEAAFRPDHKGERQDQGEGSAEEHGQGGERGVSRHEGILGSSLRGCIVPPFS